jgi:D-alanine-D-alanine ligase
MSNKLRIGVLFGGRSGEHEVSLMSASSVIEALDKSKYNIVPIGITKTGKWIADGDPLQALKDGAAVDQQSVHIVADPSQRALAAVAGSGARSKLNKLDIVFPALHGPYGEDGTVQGLLEMAGIPYVGASVLGSAAGMDKAIMKALFRDRGLPMVDYMVRKRVEWRKEPEQTLNAIEQELGYPCFVKPACLGSSVGISKAHNRSELPVAMDEAAKYDRKIVVEQSAEGFREVECSVLGNDDPIVSIPGEIVPSSEFYDYQAKYHNDDSTLLIPAPLPEATVQEVQRLAIASFEAIDCCGLARVDFFVSQDGAEVLVNEINTLPGFTSISMYPKLWEASGLGMTQLLDRLIELALERHEQSNTQH